ncbi:MAG: hypothetical protein AAGF12_35880, partial [Myxococcota bacterium]
MALLRPLLKRAPLVFVLLSCDGRSESGYVELDFYQERVVCLSEECLDGGVAPEPAEVSTWGFFSTQTSAHTPDGLYVYTTFDTDRGAAAQVEIDVSLVDRAATARYTEFEDQVPVFSSTSVRGVIRLPVPFDNDCGCSDGQFDLEFVDHGSDEVLGTEDDQVRRLTRARFSWDRAYCVSPVFFGPLPEAGIEVRAFDACPTVRNPMTPRDPEPPRPRSRDPYYYDDYDSSCEADCEGDSTSGSSGGGCDSDSCEGDSSDGGCDGDSGGGGCEGDSGGGDACEGDSGGGDSCDG